MRRRIVTGCVLAILTVGCGWRATIELYGQDWDTRVNIQSEREEGVDAESEEGDVLLPSVRVPAPVEEREMQETRPDGTDEEGVRIDGAAQREGTRVDARAEKEARVWRTCEQGRRELISWAKQLCPGWAWFATMTFRNQTASLWTAVERWRSWLSAFPKGRAPFRSVLWSAEGHKTGAVHLHALLESTGTPSSAHCKACKSVWSSPAGEWSHLNECWFHHQGIGRFYPYDESKGHGGVAYVTKYILSDEMLDWNYWILGEDYSIGRTV